MFSAKSLMLNKIITVSSAKFPLNDAGIPSSLFIDFLSHFSPVWDLKHDARHQSSCSESGPGPQGQVVLYPLSVIHQWDGDLLGDIQVHKCNITKVTNNKHTTSVYESCKQHKNCWNQAKRLHKKSQVTVNVWYSRQFTLHRTNTCQNQLQFFKNTYKVLLKVLVKRFSTVQIIAIHIYSPDRNMPTDQGFR